MHAAGMEHCNKDGWIEDELKITSRSRYSGYLAKR